MQQAALIRVTGKTTWTLNSRLRELELCQLRRALPVKHDAPSDDVPLGHSVEHPAGVRDAPACRVRPDQRRPDEAVVRDPDTDGQPVRAPHERGGIGIGIDLAAQGGAEKGWERTATWRGQAGAVKAGAGGDRKAR